MKRIFFATKNKYKIKNMKDRLKEYEIVTPYDLNIDINIEENGTNVIENALIKAKAYFNVVNMPTIATDSALYVDKFVKQPGLYVRRINGNVMTDDELEAYYQNELNKIGGKSSAYYITGVAFIQDSFVKCIELKEDEFLFTSTLYKGKKNNDPLGRLEYDEKLQKYFCQLAKNDKKNREYTFDKKLKQFIEKNYK